MPENIIHELDTYLLQPKNVCLNVYCSKMLVWLVGIR